MLAEARANTAAMPAVTMCPPALPCGSQSPTECFIGMRKAKKGESGSVAWEDLATLKSHRARWREAWATIKPKSKETLEKAMTAKTLADLSDEGGHKRTTERRGARLLKAANDDIADTLKKWAS